MLLPDVLLKAVKILTTDDFYAESHRTLWTVMVQLFKEEVPVDLATISKRLADIGKFEQVGGSDFLITLMDIAGAHADNDYYIQQVKEFSKRRALALQISGSLTKLPQSNQPLRRIATDLIGHCFKAIDEDYEDEIVYQHDTYRDFFRRLDNREFVRKTIPTGFSTLDRLFTGFAPGDLYLIGARPGIGKTAFMLDIVTNVSLYHNTYLFSLEMTLDQLEARLTSKMTGIDIQQIMSGQLNDYDMELIVNASPTIADRHLFLDVSPRLRPSEIYSKVKLHSAKIGEKPGLVIVDYLQLMSPDEKIDSREQQVASISRILKAVARKLEVPILVLSQLNRQIENRPVKEREPKLSDIRESGALEQDASVVIGLCWGENPGDAKAIVLKNRNGPLGFVNLRFIRHTATFKEKCE